MRDHWHTLLPSDAVFQGPCCPLQPESLCRPSFANNPCEGGSPKLHFLGPDEPSPASNTLVPLAIRPVLQSWLSPQDISIIWAASNLVFFAFLKLH